MSERLIDTYAAQDVEFITSVVAGTWGKKAQAEVLADLSGGDEAIAQALSAACALGGARALADTLATLRPGWRPKHGCGLDWAEARPDVQRALDAAYALGGWKAGADVWRGYAAERLAQGTAA